MILLATMNAKIVLISILFSSGFTNTALAVFGWFHRRNPSSLFFSLLSLSYALLCFGYGFELSSQHSTWFYRWAFVEQSAFCFMPAFLLLFAFAVYGCKPLLKPPLIFLPFLLPLISIILLSTNSWHFLFYKYVGFMIKRDIAILSVTEGPWGILQLVYLYVAYLASSLLFLLKWAKNPPGTRGQVAVLTFGSFFVFGANLAYLIGQRPYGLNLSPFLMTLTGLINGIALFGFDFFAVVPLARDRAFEGIKEPVLVFDSKDRLADYNRAAGILFPRLKHSQVGEKLQNLMKSWPQIVGRVAAGQEGEFDFQLPLGPDFRYFHCYLFPVRALGGRSIGKTLVLTEVTAQTRLIERIRVMAEIDPLTGVYNRRQFMELFHSKLESAREAGDPFSLLMIDIDFFKMVNDNFGHQAGDAVLVEIVKLTRFHLRGLDIFGRFGGEEFLIFLPDSPPESGAIVAERIRQKIEANRFRDLGEMTRVTVSIGLTGSDGLCERSMDELVGEADEALYEAKRRGRNRVEWAKILRQPLRAEQV